MCHLSVSSSLRAGGISARFPSGAPLSTQATIVAISWSLKDGSSLNFRIPTFRSMNHSGMSRLATFSLIERGPWACLLAG